MLGVHSLAPAKLYTGTATKAAAAPKPQPAAASMLETTQPVAAAASSHDGPTLPSKGGASRPDALAQQHTAPSRESRDSAVADLEAANELRRPTDDHPLKPHTDLARGGDARETQTASMDFFSSREAHAGPSQPARVPSAHSSLQPDGNIADDMRPDETHQNAIAYRRDPETVIAYLVPLPKPTVQGVPLDVPTRYFLYAPPPPHLVKPTKGSNGNGSGSSSSNAAGSEGYVRRLNRRWQQSVHKSKANAHNGKRVSLRGSHSKTVRGLVRGLDKLKYDDVTFLARVHPSTVTHLILIHPSGLSDAQAPEDLLRTFRAQVFESKKRAKKGSILSAALFFPALAIDTAAIFFGGLAEVDGIWMLVSIKAYRTARVITRKIGPEPKTLEVEQKKLIEDAKRNGFPAPEPEVEEEDSEPGAIRRSVDALRKSMGSVKYRMNYKRSKSKKTKGDDSSTDTSRPQTMGGDLADHQEEEGNAVTPEGEPAPEPEISGWLEHASEDEDNGDGAPGPSVPPPNRSAGSGGILQDHDNLAESGESDQPGAESHNGENFQLTFYPSPAMDVLTRYMQEACHRYNAQAFTSPTGATTEQDVFDVMGWHPERREHDTAEQIAEDEQWQRRDIEDDLRLVAIKAAKAWDKSCRKAAKKPKRFMSEKPGKKRVFAGRFKVRRPRVQKGKAKESPAVSDPEAETSAAAAAAAAAATTTSDSPRRSAKLNLWARSRKEKPSQEKSPDNQQSKRSRAAGKAALLCVPCIAVAKRAKRGKTQDETNAAGDDEQARAQADGAGRGVMRQRFSARGGSVKRGLSTRSDALRQRMEALKAKKTSTAGDGVGDEGPSPAMMNQAAAVEGQTPTGEAQPGAEADTAEPKKSKAAWLLAIPVGVAATIGAAMKKRGQGKKTSADEGDASSTTGVKENGKFSAIKRHLRSLRTRVTKKRRVPSPKAYVQDLKQKRNNKKAEGTTGAAATTEPKSVKEHGAMVGLMGGFLALPAAKLKEVRDKRRQSKPESENSEAPADGPGMTAAPPTVEDRISHDRPRFEPTIAEEAEGGTQEPSQPPSTTQYLPGHGQSEIPVATTTEGETSHTEPRLGSSETAVDETVAPTTTTINEPQQPPPESQGASQGASAAAAEKLRSLKNGLGNLKPKRRAAGDATDPPAVHDPAVEPREDETVSPSGGSRLQTLRDGLGNLKPKKRTGAEASQQDGPVEAGIVQDTATPGDSAPKDGRFKSIKDGIGNLKAKKTGTEEPQKQKKYKDSNNPGFMDRMRWIWLMS